MVPVPLHTNNRTMRYNGTENNGTKKSLQLEVLHHHTKCSDTQVTLNLKCERGKQTKKHRWGKEWRTNLYCLPLIGTPQKFFHSFYCCRSEYYIKLYCYSFNYCTVHILFIKEMLNFNAYQQHSIISSQGKNG